MNLFQHLLMSLGLGLIIYLLIQNQQLQGQLAAVYTLQQGSTESMGKTLTPLTEKLEAIHLVISKLSQEAEANQNKKLANLQKRLDLYKTLAVLNQVELLRVEAKGVEAADKLASTKKIIWSAGEALADKKTRLQALMGPIDKLMEAWKAGDLSPTTDTVRKELEAVLGELGND